MGIRRQGAAVVAAAAALTWLTPASAGGAQTEPGPTLTVTPDTELVDGQTVEVTGAAFTPGDEVFLVQCPAGTTGFDVATYCRLHATRTADDSGRFSMFMAVTSEVGSVDCAASPGACTVAAVDISPMSVVAAAPIAFADGQTTPPSISVAPSTGLDHGDVVTVTGADFPADTEVSVAQCQSTRPLTAEWCAAEPGFTATTDATGAFAGELTIERGVTLGSGDLIDCAGRCVVGAFTADGTSSASEAIRFTDRLFFPFPERTLTVTPQGSVLVTGTLMCFPEGSDIVIDGTLTQVVEDRTISVPFRTSTACEWMSRPWEDDIAGYRTERFKVGTATLTFRANEAVDPLPGDEVSATMQVDLVRPER